MRQLNLPTRLVAILEDNKPATAGASRANRPLKTLRMIPGVYFLLGFAVQLFCFSVKIGCLDKPVC
mgnify:CR=1 FL=1